MPDDEIPSVRAQKVFRLVLIALLVFVLTAPFWRPRWEAAMWARCEAGYAAARTGVESTTVDHLRPLMPKLHEIDRRTACIDLRRTHAVSRASR